MINAHIGKGDALTMLRRLADESIDAVITDPPYGLSNTDPKHVADTITRWATGEREYVPEGAGFMGKAWDAFVPPPAVWDECMRVLKPGGHVVAFAGSRTFDLMTLSIRLAGFDIRDSLAWLYGSGFPKSMDVSKAIDKAAGAEREVVGVNPRAAQQTSKSGTSSFGDYAGTSTDLTAPATDDAKAWAGWGTALKPAFEPIVLARKPLIGTVAANVIEHGTGALNIDATRIGTGPRPNDKPRGRRPRGMGEVGERTGDPLPNGPTYGAGDGGRFPANVILDESQAAALDEQSGEGGASRFFYVAKAPKRERPEVDGVKHPTVKPIAVMRWLIRLVTPPGGTVLDPFAGSGTTIEAAILEGFDSLGIEMTPEYWPLIEHRIERARNE